MIKVFVKTVEKRELDFLLKLEGLEITPKLLKYEINNTEENSYDVYIEEYPWTLSQYADIPEIFNKYHEKIKDLITKLHDLNIYHGDLTFDNIVIDIDNDKVRLIDFGESLYFHEINDNYITKVIKNLQTEETCKTFDDIIDAEFTLYKRCVEI